MGVEGAVFGMEAPRAGLVIRRVEDVSCFQLAADKARGTRECTKLATVYVKARAVDKAW